MLKKYDGPIIFLCIFFMLTGLWGLSLYRRSLSRPVTARVPVLLVTNHRYQHVPEVVAELKAEGDLYRGRYAVVEQALKGRFLSPRGVGLLARAELAAGDPAVLGLLKRFDHIPLVRGMWGFYLAQLGYFQGATEVLTTTLAETDDEILQLGLASIYLKEGQNQEAKQILAKVKAEDPASSQLKVVEGDLALTGGDYGQAWNLYMEAKKQGHLEDDPLFITQLGIAAIGADKETSSIIAHLREIDGQSGLAEYLEAQDSLYHGRLRDAVAQMNTAMASAGFPSALRPEAVSFARGIEERLQAEPAIAQVIAQGGH